MNAEAPARHQQQPNVRVWDQARSYVEAAEILMDYNRIQPAAVMAALAIEILAKSFLATRMNSGAAVTERGHYFGQLVKKIDAQSLEELRLCSQEVDSTVDLMAQLKKHLGLFVDGRYWYEPEAPLSFGSDTIYFARHFCEVTFLVGKKRGV